MNLTHQNIMNSNSQSRLLEKDYDPEERLNSMPSIAKTPKIANRCIQDKSQLTLLELFASDFLDKKIQEKLPNNHF